MAAVLNEFPVDNQLYPRDLASNLATVTVSGFADSSSIEVALRAYRDDVLWRTLSQPIDDTLSYAISIQIPAELARYDFELVAIDTNGSETQLAAAANVVAGDVYVVNGQSNAESGQYEGSGAGDVSNFIRTFGWWQADTWQNDDKWYVPLPDCSGSPPCVGQWGLRFGSNIVDAEQVPVAIINSAIGGRAIDHFQRNDANPADLSTNFGRLLTRLTATQINDDVRAIIWYQGESDGSNYTGHINGFTNLYQDWEDTYASIERYYVFQIRSGCGSDLHSETSNAQREFALQRLNVTPVSTTGLDGHDGCHYAYANGYQQIGDNMARIIRKDLYNRPLQNADAADIRSATVVDSNNVDLTFTTGNQLVADSGFEELFELRNEDSNQLIPISNGTILAGDSVRLTTSQALPSDVTLSINYLSPPGDQNWITNQAGIGILSFLRFPVQTAPVPCGPLQQEAENGSRYGGFETGGDSNASNNQYVHVPEGGGYEWDSLNESRRVDYCFTITEAGDYAIKGVVYAPDSESDSFYVQVNDAPANGYLWDTSPGLLNQYVTDYVNDRNTGSDQVIVNLAVGEQKVSIYLREDGTRLDTLALEKITTPPSVLGDVNCDGRADVVDALFILQHVVDLRSDSGGCPLSIESSLHAAVGDIDGDEAITAGDALFILQCEADIRNTFCP